jgi:hypothetical protein
MADQILDGGDVINLQNDVKIVDGQVLALQGGDELVARIGIRQAQD